MERLLAGPRYEWTLHGMSIEGFRFALGGSGRRATTGRFAGKPGINADNPLGERCGLCRTKG
jgi:hypothetical protein